ncbi:MAG: hypothetical protein ACK47B_05235 [Armatimonadota bacterium]
MEGLCPHCHVRLDLPESGAYECDRCRKRFEVALGSPTPPVPVGYPAYGAPGYAAAGTVPPGFGAAGVAGYAPPGAAWGYAPPAAPQPATELGAPCANHPSNAAVGSCERCGDFICRLCTTRIEGHGYCPRCFELLHQRGALQTVQRQFTLPSTSLSLSILGFLGALVTWCFVPIPAAGPVLAGLTGIMTLPLGIAGLAVGARAMREHRLRPELPRRGVSIAGLSLGVATVVLVLAAWIFLWISGASTE